MNPQHRHARIRTTHASPETAAVVAGAVRPDNTDSMTTRVDGSTVVTTIDRETTGGLHSSVDDYVVNLTVANRLATTAAETAPTAETTREPESTDDYQNTTHNNE